jgi:hypothetical protein
MLTFAGCAGTLSEDSLAEKASESPSTAAEPESTLGTFSGAVSQPSAIIELYGARTAAEPGELLGTTRAGSVESRAGSSAYEWSISAAIPAALWQALDDTASGCAERATFVWAVSNGTLLPVRGGAADASGKTRLVSGETFEGDLSISTQDEADAQRCVTDVHGNLSINPTSELGNGRGSISLPNLQRVTGSLSLELQDRELATSSGSCYEPERFLARSLTEVGGDLHVSARVTHDQGIDLGLDGLHRIGGNLSIQFTGTNLGVAGFSGLSAVDGSLDLGFSADVGLYRRALVGVDGACVAAPQDRPALLDGVQRVGGDLTVKSGSDAYWILPHLQSVGGNAFISARAGASFLPELAHIEGGLTLGDKAGGAALASIESVGGELHVANTGYSAWPLRASGAPTTVAGDISIEGNLLLATIARGSIRTLAVSQRVAIRENPLLPSRDICAFVGALREQGWSGASDLDGRARCVVFMDEGLQKLDATPALPNAAPAPPSEPAADANASPDDELPPR